MVRWVIFSVAVVALTAAATLCSTYLAAGTAREELVLTGRDKPAGPPGTASVEEPLVYKFGTMPQKAEGAHEWVLTNKGQGEIKITPGKGSCSCTIANLAEGATASLPRASRPRSS